MELGGPRWWGPEVFEDVREKWDELNDLKEEHTEEIYELNALTVW